jgi:hypothetical protein
MRTGYNPPRGRSAVWWVLTTANAAGTNGLTCLPKHSISIWVSIHSKKRNIVHNFERLLPSFRIKTKLCSNENMIRLYVVKYFMKVENGQVQ